MTQAKMSPCQEQVLVQLVSKTKTLEEIHEKTSLPYREVMTAAKQLILQGAIEKKQGFPTRYRITKPFQMVAKKLRAKFDMSDLLDDPCDIFGKSIPKQRSK